MLKKMKISNDEKGTFCKAQTENILHLFWGCDIEQQFWLLFKKFVIEKCTNVTNMTLHEDFVLFGNVKDIESDEIFDFIVLLAKFFFCKCKMENKIPFFHEFVKQLTSRFKMEEY